MIRLLIGENDYAVNQEVEKLIADTSGSVKKFWAEEAEVGDILRAASEQSLFDDPVDLVVVRRLQDNKSLAGDLADKIDQFGETDILITADKVDKRSKLYKSAKKNKSIEEFAHLNPAQLESFARDLLKQSSIDTSLARSIAQRSQSQVGVVAAVKTLELAASDGKVSTEQFDALVPETPEDNIFNFLDQVLSGNAQKAISMYDDLLRANLDPGYVAAMISWQLANIAAASLAGNGGARSLKMNPYVFDKAQRAGGRLSKDQMYKLVDLACEYELTMKTKSVNLPQLTRQMIYKLQFA